MLTCPHCETALSDTTSSRGVFWICPSCEGRTATLAFLRRHIAKHVVNSLWQTARSGNHPHLRPCPACKRLMAEVPAGHDLQPAYLDVCTRCHLVWFDTHEFEALPVLPEPSPPEDQLPPKAREALAMVEVQAIAEQAEREYGRDDLDELWQIIPAILGIPSGQDTQNPNCWPWLTWALAIIICGVTLLAGTNLPSILQRFGLIPSDPWRTGGLTLLTSFLLQGGLTQLVIYVYFLVVFGVNVEVWLGHGRYLLTLLLATMAGAAAHVISNPAATVPLLSAAGGISGIITLYTLQFPGARLGMLWLLPRFVLFWTRMPAWGLCLLWVAIQVYGVREQLAGFDNVSLPAHLGGASVGLLIWLVSGSEALSSSEPKSAQQDNM